MGEYFKVFCHQRGTMIADEMAPEAFERSAIYAGVATVAGFAFALFLTSLE